jgi:hypothetical protein
MRSILSLGFALAVAAPVAGQSGFQDQSSPFGNASFNGGTNVLTWQAEVAVGIAGTLEGVELEVYGAAGATLDVRIRVGPGWNVGAAAFSGTVTTLGSGAYERVFVDTSAAAIALAVGDLFVIEMVGNTGVNIRGQYNPPPATPPYPEELYLNGPGCFADCGWRIGFNTWMTDGGPQLAKTGTCPGSVTLSVTGATPGGSVAMLSGPAGSFTQTGNPCNGLTLQISTPTFHGFLLANGSGAASLTFNAPPSACGRTVQGVDLSSCTATNTVVL